jgi:hypothetical protein
VRALSLAQCAMSKYSRSVLARLHAGWLLGWSLLKTLLLLVFRPGRRGLQLFEQNFRQDRLLPLAQSEQGGIETLSSCVACGRCDDGYGAWNGAEGEGFHGLMSFVLSATRSMPDYEASAAMVAGIDEPYLRRMEDRCPSGMPFRRMVSFVRTYEERLRKLA